MLENYTDFAEVCNKFAQKLCCRATKVDEKGMNVEKKQ